LLASTKVKVKSSCCLTKHHAMQMYGRVEILLQTLFLWH
jgi:hypothetical protein